MIDPTTLNYSAYFELFTDLRENPWLPQALRKMRDLGVDLIHIGNGPHVYLNGSLLANLSHYEVICHNNGVYFMVNSSFIAT
ncbi:MAG: hypothetical protein DRJ68_05925 [Thermoprotei archaeon]|nr:MAG: hypothetical protein DRJ68_05925 [Thermoprotei archaeon]